MTTHPDHHRISEMAYRLWEQDGKPLGLDVQYWLKAEALIAEDASPVPSNSVPPAADEPVTDATAPKKPRKPRVAKPKA